MQLEALLAFDDIVIQCHDDPDADAIASGFALQEYLKSQGKQTKLVYSGPRRISKGNLTKMVKLFNIDITYMEPAERASNPPELLITVDCQDGESNVTPLPRRELAAIDHHRAERGGEKEKDTLREVRSDYGACSTILWSMLKDAGFALDKTLSSVLYYGLYMDTVAFKSLASAHAKDQEMRRELEGGEWNRDGIEELKRANLNAETLRIVGRAISELHIYRDYHFAVAQAQPCDPNILGVISDQVMEVDGVDLCVSYCWLPEEARTPNKEVKFSVRSYLTGIPASDLAKYVANGLGGDAGGRTVSAGGVLSERELRQEIANTAEIGWDGFSPAVGRLIYRKIADYCENSIELRKAYPDIAQKLDAPSYIQRLHAQAEQGDPCAQNNLGLCYFYGDNVEQDAAQAVEWFRRAAEQGLAEAQSNLGVCCREDGTEGMVQAAEWFRRAAEQGLAEAQHNLALYYYNGEGVERDLKQAVQWFRKAAEQGLADAQLQLGFRYDHGEGVDKDPAQAVQWYRKAAEQGLASAQAMFGFCCHTGREGVVRNFEQAVQWYRKAAEQGLADAQYQLGSCYYNGEGVEQDPVQAVEWLHKAAEQGHANAQYGLGYCYCNGHGVEQDLAQAVEWYRKAAGQGYAEAQKALGSCCMNGSGLEKDSVQAVEWFRKAAEQGHAGAQYCLGNCYYTGDGVEQDFAQAVRWYYEAVKQGCADALYNLGVCYYNGDGVEKDPEQAVRWFHEAAKQGDRNARQILAQCYEEGTGVQRNPKRAAYWRGLAEQ